MGPSQYLLELQCMAAVIGIPTEAITELCADIVATKPTALVEVSPPRGQVALLKGGHVRPLEDIEREALTFAIEHYCNQMSEVARRLKIGRSTLYRKMENLGIPP